MAPHKGRQYMITTKRCGAADGVALFLIRDVEFERFSPNETLRGTNLHVVRLLRGHLPSNEKNKSSVWPMNYSALEFGQIQNKIIQEITLAWILYIKKIVNMLKNVSDLISFSYFYIYSNQF